jgi:hypothetical protein
MHPNAYAANDPIRLARAFLALTDDVALEPVQRSLVKVAAAAAAVLVLAFAAPLTWVSPAPVAPGKVGDQPAATLGNTKALPGALDDEDDGAG